ncbi:MAG: DUF222 domain-containing protein [Acidimicrobiia bacterium]
MSVGYWEQPFDENFIDLSEEPGFLDAVRYVPPGPTLSNVLSGVDRTELNGHNLVTVIRARGRQIAMLQAEQLADIAELAFCPPGPAISPPMRQAVPDEFAADEIRAAMTLTRMAAETMMQLALGLVDRLPAVWQGLQRGRIDLPKARVLLEGTDHLDEIMARETVARLLPDAPNLTTGELRARLRKLCIDIDPDDAAKRYRRGVDDREVVANPNPDGTADLLGRNLPADQVAGIIDRLTRMAKKARSADDFRNIDQIRADLFLELLEGRHRQDTKPRPLVDIRVDLDTLIGLNDTAAEIPGWGPVIADIARQALQHQPDGQWRVIVTDPDSGNVLWDGTTRRRPTAEQRRYVEARQTTCTFPGCRGPAHRSDYDHTTEAAKGGRTTVANGGPACRHDHRLRHDGNWTIDQPSPGHYKWTSPHGHVYETFTSGSPP